VTDSTRPHRYLSNEYVRSNALPLTLISQDEMVRRIEEARLEEAPSVCPTCGSATPDIRQRKWCPGCRLMLPIVRFSRDRSRADRLRPVCRTCCAASSKSYRSQVARNGGIGARGRVVKVSGHMTEAIRRTA
jgi:hypothetical protein